MPWHILLLYCVLISIVLYCIHLNAGSEGSLCIVPFKGGSRAVYSKVSTPCYFVLLYCRTLRDNKIGSRAWLTRTLLYFLLNCCNLSCIARLADVETVRLLFESFSHKVLCRSLLKQYGYLKLVENLHRPLLKQYGYKNRC